MSTTPSQPLQPQAGDVLLFRTSGRWYERLICRATDGDVVHAELVVDPEHSVGALITGVELHAIPQGRDVVLVPTGARLRAANAPRLLRALLWLEKRTGCRYGWLSIVADGFKAVLPRWLGSRTPFLVSPRAYDCSQLATDFLIHAGAELPDELMDCPSRVSPNDLARAFGVPTSAPGVSR